MKASLFIADGVAMIATAVYFWKFRKTAVQTSIPEKENERHHLTNIFSKAKEVAIGN